MRALFFRSSPHFPCAFAVKSSSSIQNEQTKNPIAINLQDRHPSLKLAKRTLLQFIAVNPFFVYAYPVFSAPIMEPKEPEVIRTLKLADGVTIQEIIEGGGAEAREGDTVEVNYVCRRSNGYFVHSTVDQFSGESSPVILPLDENQIIMGLKEVLIGMRVGGKRRALIPPLVGYINDNLQPIPEEFGPRRSLLSHRNEPLIFEKSQRSRRLYSAWQVGLLSLFLCLHLLWFLNLWARFF